MRAVIGIADLLFNDARIERDILGTCCPIHWQCRPSGYIIDIASSEDVVIGNARRQIKVRSRRYPLIIFAFSLISIRLNRSREKYAERVLRYEIAPARLLAIYLRHKNL